MDNVRFPRKLKKEIKKELGLIVYESLVDELKLQNKITPIKKEYVEAIRRSMIAFS